jgi:hypothetical protein
MVLWTIHSAAFGVSGFIAAIVLSSIVDICMIVLLFRNRRERMREQEDSNMYAVSNLELIRS